MSTELHAVQQEVPAGVRAATILWVIAVGAGAFEMALALFQMSAFDSGTAVGVGVRLAVFAVAILLALRLKYGGKWPRIILAIGLGVFGTLSLVLEPVQWLLEGHAVGAFLAAADVQTLLSVGARIVHLLAVLGATALMFSPPVNTFYRQART